MHFYEAIKLVQEGKSVRLKSWNEGVKIKAQFPDSKMTHPYLYVESIYGRVPWVPTQVEMFSMSWEEC